MFSKIFGYFSENKKEKPEDEKKITEEKTEKIDKNLLNQAKNIFEVIYGMLYKDFIY